MNSTDDRISRLEKSVRAWQRITMGVVFAMVATACAGAVQQSPKLMKAQKFVASEFELVNIEGKTLGSLKASDNDARLSLFGPSGKVQADIGSSGGEGAITLMDKEQQAHMTFRAGGFSGGTEIRLMDEKVEDRLILTAKRGEKTSIVTKSGEKITAHLP